MLQALSLVAIALTKKLTLRCGISIPAIAFGLKRKCCPDLIRFALKPTRRWRHLANDGSCRTSQPSEQGSDLERNHSMKSCRVAETSEELMRRISIFSAAAILVAAVASPSITQAACAQYDPGCATYPMPKKEDAAKSTSVRAGVGAEVGAQQPADRSTVRTGVRAEVGAQQPADRSTVRTGVRAEVGAQQPADRSTVRTGVRAEVGAQQPADRSTLRTGVRAEVGAQQPADHSTVRTG